MRRVGTPLRPEDAAHMEEIRLALPEVAPDLLPSPTACVRVALRIAAQELRRRRERREHLRAKRLESADGPEAQDPRS